MKALPIVLEMSSTDVVAPVGNALFEYLNYQGLLLADVHFNNIGRLRDGQAIITDPGHVVAISPRWTEWPLIPMV